MHYKHKSEEIKKLIVEAVQRGELYRDIDASEALVPSSKSKHPSHEVAKSESRPESN